MIINGSPAVHNGHSAPQGAVSLETFAIKSISKPLKQISSFVDQIISQDLEEDIISTFIVTKGTNVIVLLAPAQ